MADLHERHRCLGRAFINLQLLNQPLEIVPQTLECFGRQLTQGLGEYARIGTLDFFQKFQTLWQWVELNDPFVLR